MNRRRAIELGLALAASPLLLRAQSARKPARIGVLSSTSPEARSGAWDAFTDGMAKLGWVEGLNLIYVYRYARGDVTRFDALAEELLAEKPDLIFAGLQPAALAVQRATREIPIVFGFALDPVGSGLVASLAHPGGNATGLANFGIDLMAKHFELLKEIRPKLRRVAVMVSKTAMGQEQLKAAERAARVVGAEILPISLGAMEELGRAFDSLARNRPDGALIQGFTIVERRQVIDGISKLRIPAVYSISEFVTAGGLMSYAAEIRDNYRRAAGYADKILRGAKPADLPVEQSAVFELVINLKTAQAQGIKIPQSVLLRATKIIE